MLLVCASQQCTSHIPIEPDERSEYMQTLPICSVLNKTQPVPLEKEPRGHKMAIRAPRWKQAMEREVNQLVEKHAWDLVDRPRDTKVLPGLWQFKIKRDENGQITKYKARWCADGSRSPLDIPPEIKFSPVAEKSTIRMIFAIAAHKGVPVIQADFPNAYLNAKITEDTYVVQPGGLEDPNNVHKICKLNKALYGMPISGKCWHDALSSCVGILTTQPSCEGSQATVACRSLGIINSTYSAITRPRTSRLTSRSIHLDIAYHARTSFLYLLQC